MGIRGFVVGCICLIAAAGAGENVVLEGILSDTAFPPPAPVRLEVLETGDTLTVIPGAPFRVALPRDTVWNLCFSARPDGDSADRREKCYELRHAGADTAFSAALGEGPAVEIAAPATAGAGAADTAAAAAVDTAAARPEEAMQLKKVVVRAQRAPKRSLGKSTVSAKLIKRMPGLAEADVIRSIQALPGVVASSDFSTKIYVRGGSSDQNLILLDRAVVYSPVHFFGLFSTFLVEGVDKVDFYKGGFPPEYGNRLSSVLDISSREGGRDTVPHDLAGSFKVSTFASQFHAEGRHGPFRYLMAGRRTYIDQVLRALRAIDATDLDLNYFFYDLQGNAVYEHAAEKQVMASWYSGRDRLLFTPFEVEWGNTVIPVNFAWRLAKDLETEGTASYSLFSQSFGLENIFEFYNRIATAAYRQSLTWTGLDGHRLTAGIDVNWMETIFINNQIIAKIKLRDDTRFFLNSMYVQEKWTLGQAEFTGGARVTHSTRLEEPSFEPRLSLKYRLPKSQSLDFHVGYYAQYVNSIQFADQESLNEFYYPAKKVKYRTVKPTTSILFSAGWGMDRLWDELDLTAEAYYKTLDHLTVFAPNDVPDSVAFDAETTLGDLFKEGKGYSYGFELSLRRPEGLVFGGISYSNGTSVTLDDGTTEAFYPSWHQPHSLKADLAINWFGRDGLWARRKNRKGTYFRSSTQLKYATGLPYTEFIGYMPAHYQDQNQGRGANGPNPEFDENINLLRGNRNAAFVPAYFRWDAKVVDWGVEGRWNFSATILNLTDHKNIFFYTYDREQNPPQRIEITQFPFFPFLVNYELSF